MPEQDHPSRGHIDQSLPERRSLNPEVPPIQALLAHAQRVERENRHDPGFLSDIEYGQKKAERIRQALENGEISPETADFIHGVERAELKKDADRDYLTDLPNRRTTFKRLDEELAQARRFRVPLSVAYLDLDHFKQINDGLSHAIGDALLVHVADHLRASLREYDIAGRIGGEEFVLILPQTSENGARLVIERIREGVSSSVTEALRQTVIAATGDTEKANAITITVSGGVAQLSHEASQSSDAAATRDKLLQEADNRLYLAKRNGRNRIVGSEEERNLTKQSDQQEQ